MSAPGAELSALLDRQAIAQLSIDYMRALDRLDIDLLRSVYHPDASDERGFFSGSAQDFCDFAMAALKDHHANHHMLGQMDIVLEGDTAFGEIYFQAFHRIEQNGEELDFVVIGRYVDRYERRGGVWKIAHRSELNDASWTRPAADLFLTATPTALRGARGVDDLSSQRERVRRL